MVFVIGAACVDVTDRSCVDECPVDCVYEGDRKLYIHPEECIDCGACAPVCPVEAISRDATTASEHYADAVRFFYEPLPSRAGPVGAPGGAAVVGRVGVDTPAVAALARREL